MKFKKDLFWNYVSLMIMAIAGLLMNTLIGYFYDSSVLGIFNETYAWYMILSQITVWGIHMSVLKLVPEQESEIEKGNILISALFIVLIISVLIIVIVEGLLLLFENVAWKNSLQIAVTGLLFFSLNKILLNYQNSLSEMTSYAIFQMIRYFMLILSITIFSLKKIQYNMLALTFPITEGLIFLILFIYTHKQGSLKGKICNSCMKELFVFGTKILPSNMVVEMNTKVDVVCLGLLVNDTAQIGVYSFAILFSEGFYQLYITLRKIIDPQIAEWNVQNRLEEFLQLVQKIGKKYFLMGTVAVYVLILLVYIFVVKIMLSDEYRAGVFYLAIVCFAMGINGKSIILGNILAQTGYPLQESKLNIITVLCNIIFNIIFITLWGTIGAAVASAISYFVYGTKLKRFVRDGLGIIL